MPQKYRTEICKLLAIFGMGRYLSLLSIKVYQIFYCLSIQATFNFSNIEHMLAEMKTYLGFLIPKVTISTRINILLLKSAVIPI